MKKYFGILNNDKINNLSLQEQLDFLIDNNLFYFSRSYLIDLESKGVKDKTENPKIELIPGQLVINAFYEYLKELFSREIDQPFLLFFNDFNEKIYGLDKTVQRKIALQYFNERYKKIKVLEASFVKREKDDSGVEQVKNMNRFDFLKGRQNGQKQQLATTDNVLEFLNGNDDYFKNESFKNGTNNNTNNKQFIEFETNLKILISLNGQHHFEDDYHFSDLGLLKNLFEKYNDTFKSLKVFVYTHKKIQNFTASKTAQTTSLFDALFAMGFIPNSKADFMKYVNREHQMNLTKLKYFQSEENRQHDQRVKQFKLELQEYSSEK